MTYRLFWFVKKETDYRQSHERQNTECQRSSTIFHGVPAFVGMTAYNLGLWAKLELERITFGCQSAHVNGVADVAGEHRARSFASPRQSSRKRENSMRQTSIQKFVGVVALGLMVVGMTLIAGCPAGPAESEGEAELNSLLQQMLPEGAYPLDADPEVDSSINVSKRSAQSSKKASGPFLKVQPGAMGAVSLGFNAPNGNVTGVGIRFGSDPSAPIWVVPQPDAQGQTAGMLSTTLDIPQDVCDMLSQICHDIKCYEFAVTDVGKISRENIEDIALACGGCDEPSCQELLGDGCVTLGTGVVQATLTWNNGADVDLYVTEPSGTVVFYGNSIGSSGELDVDDIDGFGPENYFIQSTNDLQVGTYIFSVSLFSGSPAGFDLLMKVDDDTRNFSGSASDINPQIVAQVEWDGTSLSLQ